MSIEDIMALAPVIPVLTIDDVDAARRLAATLVVNGLPVIEVTLRTPNSLAALRAMVDVEGAVVGAGTVLSPRMLDQAQEAGARFAISPGLTETLVHAAAETRLPYLPGVATASEVMRGFDLGLTHFKFFPAVALGGIVALRALTAPLSAARFCPTGGIDGSNAADWLSVPEVLCVGGTWMVPRGRPDIALIRHAAKII